MAYPICPECKATIRKNTPITDTQSEIRNGDWSVCFECGTIFIFENDSFHLPSRQEFKEFASSSPETLGKLLIAKSMIDTYKINKAKLS